MRNKTDNAAMILVMGPSGTGKTAFIKLLTENEGIDLEYNLGGPRTCKLALSNFSIRDLCVEFIDAPSFDDSVHKSPTDTDILKTIAAFLDSAHKAGKKLHGVIFMHRISDSGVSNLTKHNLRMLQHICGSDSLKNVAIVTTMWDSVNDNAAKIREEALTSDGSFKPLLDAGARLLRHDDDFTSAYVITKRLLGKQPIQLLIQTDLDQGKSIPSTAAGPELNVLIQNLIASHQKEIRKVREELTDTIEANNYAAKKALEQERQTLSGYLKGFEAKLEESLDSMKATAEAKRKAAEVEPGKQRAAPPENPPSDHKGLEVVLRKDYEATQSLLKEERVLRELFLSTGDHWSVVNVSDGVYKVVGASDGFSPDTSPPMFWLVDSRQNDFELKSKSTGQVFALQANNYANKGEPQFNRYKTTGPTFEHSGRLKPGKYTIRNRETLNLLCVYENNSLPEAKLQIWGKGLQGYPQAHDFTVSEERNGLVTITNTFNLGTMRYLIDKGGAMMNTTKSNRVRLIHAGIGFYYIMLDVEKGMVLKDANNPNMNNGYSLVEELDESDRRQLWEFLEVA